MSAYLRDDLGGASDIRGERVGNSGVFAQMLGAIRKTARISIRARDS
jgi:hypothetical protein